MNGFFTWVVVLGLLLPGVVAAEWTAVEFPGDGELRAVSRPTVELAWTCDNEGTIWVSDSGGESWSEQAALPGGDFYGISFSGAAFGSAATLSGDIHYTLDGGESWLPAFEALSAAFYDVFTVPGREASYVSGKSAQFQPYIIWTTDAWASSHEAAFYITIDGDQVEGQARAVTATADGATIVAGSRTWDGTGAICVSADGGDSFATAFTGFYTVKDVALSPDEQTYLAVTSGGQILSSEDGGGSWTVRRTADGSDLHGVCFARTNDAYAVGANGLILHSHDAGVTWVEQECGTNADLNGVSFSNGGSGIAVGAAGTVLVFSSEAGFPVTLALTPVVDLVPATGGTVVYDAHLVSTLPNPYAGVNYWTAVETPGGQVFGPLAFTSFTMPPMMDRVVSGLTQNVPAFAPAGQYTFTAHVGYFPNAYLTDSFPFTKESGAARAAGLNVPAEAWETAGRPAGSGDATAAAVSPRAFSLSTPAPNPFNSTATLALELPQDTRVELAVYSITGRRVAMLHHGPLAAGRHVFTVDGTGLASGLYFVRASVAGAAVRVRKISLLR